jgi:hypothetical protein
MRYFQLANNLRLVGWCCTQNFDVLLAHGGYVSRMAVQVAHASGAGLTTVAGAASLKHWYCS